MRTIVALMFVMLAFAGCTEPETDAKHPAEGSTNCADFEDLPVAHDDGDAIDGIKVRFETTVGDFTVETNSTYTPGTARNFLQYVDRAWYSCTTFHRIAPGFVVQGGGYYEDHQTLKQTDDPIPLESHIDKKNLQWTLSMARTNNPDSATTQFFVNLEDNANLDPWGAEQNGKSGYAVFATLIDGFETIDAMLAVPEGQSFGAGGYYPAEPIVIIRAYRL